MWCRSPSGPPLALGGDLGERVVADGAAAEADHEPGVGHAEDGVDQIEDDERDPDVRRRHRGGHAVLGQHQALDDPGLPTVLGQHPAGRVDEEGQDHHPGRDAQEPLGLFELVAVEEPRSPQGEEGDERGQVGHDPHRPVLDEHVGDVVAGSVLLLVLRPCRLLSPCTSPSTWLVARMDSRSGIFQIWVGVSSLLPPPIWKTENEQCGAGVPQRLGGRDLHRLVGALDDAQLAADEQVEEHRRQQDHERDGRGAAEGVDLRFLRRCQAETPSIITPPVTSEARTTWV